MLQSDAAAASVEAPVADDDAQRMRVDDLADDPVGRHIDNVITTWKSFDVAGFGQVQSLRHHRPLPLPTVRRQRMIVHGCCRRC